MCSTMSHKYVRSFMIGSLVGIAAGMILMPPVNEETKRRIVDRGMDMAENASHVLPGMGRK